MDDEGAEDRTQRGTPAAGQAGTSDHRRGDDVEFVSLSVARRGGPIITNGEQGGDASGETREKVHRQLHPLNLNAAEPGGLLVASDGVDAASHGEASQENAAADGHEQHDDQRYDAEVVSHFVADEPAKGRWKAADRLALGRNERDAAEDRHGAERDDERMHAQRNDQGAIGQATKRGRSHGGRCAEADPNPGRPGAGGPAGAGVVQEESTDNRGQRVNGAYGKVNAARDDHNRHAHGHDGDEARVLGELSEVLRIEEFVFLDRQRHPIAGRVGGEDALRRAVRPGREDRHRHPTAEPGEQPGEREDDEQQAALPKAQGGTERRRHQFIWPAIFPNSGRRRPRSAGSRASADCSRSDRLGSS